MFTLGGMKTSLRSLAAASALLCAIAQAAERSESYSWPVGDSPMVKLEAFRGQILVERAEEGQISLVLSARSEGDKAQAWVNQVDVTSRSFGAGLVLAVKHNSLGLEFGSGAAPEREITLTLKVPATCSLDLSTSLGSIEVANDLKGRMRARTQEGDVFFGRVDGSVNVEAVRGNITVARATGDLKARSGTGDLVIGTILGRAELRANNGSIEVMSAQGALEAESVRGDVAASLGAKLGENVSLKASAGNVKVTVDPAASLRFEAKAAWGKVTSKLALDSTTRGGNGKNRLEGVVNGGGSLVALNADGGNVSIEALSDFESLFL